MIHRKTGINGALGGGALMGEEKFYRGGEVMKGLRLILIPLLVAVFLLGVVQPAGARWGWCPIVEVEGTEVHIEATVLNGDDGDYEVEAALYLPPGTNYAELLNPFSPHLSHWKMAPPAPMLAKCWKTS